MKAPTILLLLVLPFCLSAKPKWKAKHNHMALKDDLRVYLNFEQDPVIFPPIWDQTGNGNHLNPSSGAVLAEGKIGNAVNVAGTSRLFFSSNTGISYQNGAFTVAFWFKPAVLATPLIIAGDSDGEWIVQMELSGSGYYYLRCRISPDDFDAVCDVTDVPMVIGEWYFVTLGWYDDNGSYAWASVNLSPRVRTAAVGPLVPSTTPPVFRNQNTFDEAAIWRRFVSVSELQEIYNDGEGLPFEEWDLVSPCRKITCCDP